MSESGLHSQLAEAVGAVIDESLHSTGSCGEFVGYGTPCMPRQWSSGRQKPDRSWRQRGVFRPFPDVDFAQIIVEVGVSEDAGQLAASANRWLYRSRGAVRLMLTANLEEVDHKSVLTVISWVKPGLDAAVAEFEVCMERGTDDVVRVISDVDRILVPFQRLFCRVPTGAEPEYLVLTGERFGRILTELDQENDSNGVPPAISMVPAHLRADPTLYGGQ